jgi:hypothetical protein
MLVNTSSDWDSLKKYPPFREHDKFESVVLAQEATIYLPDEGNALYHIKNDLRLTLILFYLCKIGKYQFIHQ